MAIRVLTADDHAGICDLLVYGFSKTPDCSVVGSARDGREAVRKSFELSPDVVLMDIVMPQLSGPEATQAILCHNPDTKVLCFTGHDEPEMLRAMIRSGARGVVMKTSPFGMLVEGVKTVHSGRSCFCPETARCLAESSGDDPFLKEPVLSERQLEIVRLLAQDKTSKQIAGHLGITQGRVNGQLRCIAEKLGVSGVAGILKHAFRLRWIPLS